MTEKTNAPADPLTDEQKRSKAYNAASAQLRTKYQPEFNALMKAEAGKLGLTWEPRKTEAEKAAEQVKELLKVPGVSAMLGMPTQTAPPEA